MYSGLKQPFDFFWKIWQALTANIFVTCHEGQVDYKLWLPDTDRKPLSTHTYFVFLAIF
jgi:hypothetical protein